MMTPALDGTPTARPRARKRRRVAEGYEKEKDEDCWTEMVLDVEDFTYKFKESHTVEAKE